MIKKQKKLIALLVTLTFMWLLQVSTMPLAAGETSEQLASANAEQGPNFVERTGVAGSQAAKKSILPYVLIGVGVVAVAAVLFLVVLKTDYDITGTWDFVFTYEGDTTLFTVIFRGDKASGTFDFLEAPYLYGNYNVDGKKVTMALTGNPQLPISGQFTAKDKMTGTLIDGSEVWNWTATRGGGAASLAPVMKTQSRLFPK